MDFPPAGEIIGALHQIRSVTLTEHDKLPVGAYDFVDCYCKDPDCDCRKTMIQVFHNGQLVSVANYGWEAPSYYENWHGSSSDDLSASMSGLSMDLLSPDKVDPISMLSMLNHLLDDRWKEILKRHYRLVKSATRR